MLEGWQQMIFQPLGGFMIVLLGTLLLFAEVLVRGRMIFGLLGLAAISLYFMAHMQEGQMLWMGILYLAGIMLVMIDGKFIGDGTLAAIGLILMLVALAWPSPSILYGVGVAVAFVIGASCSLLFLKFFPRRQVWSKLTLKDSLSSERGYNSLNEGYKQLLGKEGVAQTDFRPTGTIKIEGRLYSATTEGMWVKRGTRLRVTKVSGTHILVQEIEGDEQAK
ncbi:membrane-bound ClpP family serine protease [Caldalkalibacillus uzonensis]|uniref:Membrane-bound ClpP family serine protease n=1 Tax=Caldalkalibacillus uzonensis TaxID=353224 RepID=A0ABU0CVG2_9BACI|nr:NfeD family protein [Caldalkalibacillus uzonensis]MDQ0340401.1 membrane-bound ClpP family serine protease [Caldalkalibacillus uzonensis]